VKFTVFVYKSIYTIVAKRLHVHKRKELVAHLTVLLLSIGRSSQGGQSPRRSNLSRAGRGHTYICMVCMSEKQRF